MSLSDLQSSPMNVAARRPKRLHRNNGQPKPQSVLAARERAMDGGLKPDNKLLSSPVWNPLPGSTPAPLDTRTGCCWPVTDRPPHMFCNEPKAEGALPYCSAHLAIYQRKPDAGHR